MGSGRGYSSEVMGWERQQGALCAWVPRKSLKGLRSGEHAAQPVSRCADLCRARSLGRVGPPIVLSDVSRRGCPQKGRACRQGRGALGPVGCPPPGLHPEPTEAGLPQSLASTFWARVSSPAVQELVDQRVLRAPQTAQTRVYDLL